MSTPTSARSPTTTRSSPRREGTASTSGSTSSRTTPPTSTPGSPSGPSTTSGRTTCRTTGSRSSPAAARGSTTTDRKRYYLHQFAPQQPDLDWWNPDVRDEFDDILRFWFDRGVRGVRIDVAHGLIKDRELRDGDEYLRMRPEVHDIYARWQEVAAEYDPKPVLMGETYMNDLDELRPYWQHLDLAQNFPFANAEFTLSELRPIVEWTMAELPRDRQACWFASNHDHSRMATRWAHGNIDKHKAGALSAAHAARHGDPLPGRRDRPRGRRRPRRPHPRPRDPVARLRAHADAVDARRPRMAGPLAPAHRHVTQRRGPGRRPELDPQLDARPDPASARRSRDDTYETSRGRTSGSGRTGAATRPASST